MWTNAYQLILAKMEAFAKMSTEATNAPVLGNFTLEKTVIKVMSAPSTFTGRYSMIWSVNVLSQLCTWLKSLKRARYRSCGYFSVCPFARGPALQFAARSRNHFLQGAMSRHLGTTSVRWKPFIKSMEIKTNATVSLIRTLLVHPIQFLSSSV